MISNCVAIGSLTGIRFDVPTTVYGSTLVGAVSVHVAAGGAGAVLDACVLEPSGLAASAGAVIEDNGVRLHNTVIRSDLTAIWFDGANDCDMSFCVIEAPGTQTNNTYDGIRIDGSDNRITNNRVVPSATANATRYGVNIASGSCNIVVGNQLGAPADYGTDALVDNGVGTQLFYPADATYGDNFTACVGS